MGKLLEFKKNQDASWEEELSRIGKMIDDGNVSNFACVYILELNESFERAHTWFTDGRNDILGEITRLLYKINQELDMEEDQCQ